MKKLIVLCCIAGAMIGCNGKKQEAKRIADSIRMDSLARATEPAISTLAFGTLPGYSAKNTVALADSVNFFLLMNQEDVDSKFTLDQTNASELDKPDFVINFNIGVVCQPTQLATTITIDKVEVAADINVYINIEHGEKLQSTTKPAFVFAIEKRDGYQNIQFFVNGKPDKAFFLTGL
ncbi:MAG: hypothetical protein HOP08_05595 [Cyclobacteriaceae bacterium]|nr:hypothetical protein [Cyclobacteriaceae bacterium]